MNRDRVDTWAKTIAEADEVASKMRSVYLQTGNLWWFIRRPIQGICRWYFSLPGRVREAAREDLCD